MEIKNNTEKLNKFIKRLGLNEYVTVHEFDDILANISHTRTDRNIYAVFGVRSKK